MKYILTVIFLFSLISLTIGQQYPDRHSTNLADSWTSCEATENPNKVREESHWIMYDFGNEYTLYGTTFWNVNAYQHTDKGTQELVVDYSIDGENWTELAYHTMSQAPASSFYEGEEGPNFAGINARYVIVTSLSNFGHASCHGLSEVRFQATIASTTNTDDVVAQNNINVSPNPFASHTEVTLTDIKAGSYVYSVVDIAGKNILSGTVEVVSDRQTIPINMANLAPGSYVFRLEYDAIVLSKKLQLIK